MLVTGAGGLVAYSILYPLATGVILGEKQVGIGLNASTVHNFTKPPVSGGLKCVAIY